MIRGLVWYLYNKASSSCLESIRKRLTAKAPVVGALGSSSAGRTWAFSLAAKLAGR
jgi:hypothetical protein